MPRFEKDGLVIETAIATEAVALRSQGFAEQKAKTAEVRQADAAKPESK